MNFKDLKLINVWEQQSDFLIDVGSDVKYYRESEGVLRGKSLGLAIATPLVHLVASIVNIAFRILRIVSFYHFWKTETEPYTLGQRGLDVAKDALRIVIQPVAYLALEFAALYGIAKPCDGLKLYRTIEKIQYDRVLLGSWFKPAVNQLKRFHPENHLAFRRMDPRLTSLFYDPKESGGSEDTGDQDVDSSRSWSDAGSESENDEDEEAEGSEFSVSLLPAMVASDLTEPVQKLEVLIPVVEDEGESYLVELFQQEEERQAALDRLLKGTIVHIETEESKVSASPRVASMESAVKPEVAILEEKGDSENQLAELFQQEEVRQAARKRLSELEGNFSEALRFANVQADEAAPSKKMEEARAKILKSTVKWEREAAPKQCLKSLLRDFSVKRGAETFHERLREAIIQHLITFPEDVESLESALQEGGISPEMQQEVLLALMISVPGKYSDKVPETLSAELKDYVAERMRKELAAIDKLCSPLGGLNAKSCVEALASWKNLSDLQQLLLENEDFSLPFHGVAYKVAERFLNEFTEAFISDAPSKYIVLAELERFLTNINVKNPDCIQYVKDTIGARKFDLAFYEKLSYARGMSANKQAFARGMVAIIEMRKPNVQLREIKPWLQSLHEKFQGIDVQEDLLLSVIWPEAGKALSSTFAHLEDKLKNFGSISLRQRSNDPFTRGFSEELSKIKELFVIEDTLSEVEEIAAPIKTLSYEQRREELIARVLANSEEYETIETLEPGLKAEVCIALFIEGFQRYGINLLEIAQQNITPQLHTYILQLVYRAFDKVKSSLESKFSVREIGEKLERFMQIRVAFDGLKVLFIKPFSETSTALINKYTTMIGVHESKMIAIEKYNDLQHFERLITSLKDGFPKAYTQCASLSALKIGSPFFEVLARTDGIDHDKKALAQALVGARSLCRYDVKVDDVQSWLVTVNLTLTDALLEKEDLLMLSYTRALKEEITKTFSFIEKQFIRLGLNLMKPEESAVTQKLFGEDLLALHRKLFKE